MKQIYLIPPYGVTIYGKTYAEGIYGETEFNLSQMGQLIELGCARWFDISSPHIESEPPNNERPSDYIGPVSTILSRVEVWGVDWFDSETRKELEASYPKLSPIFQRCEGH